MKPISRTLLLVAMLPWLSCEARATPPNKADVARFAADVLEKHCTLDAPGAAILVGRGDEVLYRGACGSANLELGVPLSPDHVFRIGSVTKQFAAAAVLKLVDEGKVSLDDPLTKFVPGYPGGDKVTVEMLLNHTSGIRSYTDIESVMAGGGIMKDLTTAQLIETFKNEKPDFAPGEGWHYNNSGYVLVGAVIEAASGKSWHAYLGEAFFKPLGMAHTGYGNEADAVIAGHVSGYAHYGHWARAPYLSMTQPHAAGALVSTIDDLLKWNRALHEGTLLKEAGYRAMVTPTGKAVDNDYGFGIVPGTLRGEPVLEHGGGINGFNSYLLYVPGPDISVAVLQNTDNPQGMRGASAVARMLAAKAIGNPYPEKTPIDVDATTLAQYEGVYRIDKDSARSIRVADGKLTSERTGGRTYPLIPVAKDAFLFEEGFSRILFERDAEGGVVAMRFFPEDEGEGQVAPRTDEALPAARTEVPLPREAKERVVGEYEYQGVTMTILLEGDTLKTRLTGQPAFEIFAESPSRFFLKVVPATLEFSPDAGTPQKVTLRQGGAVIEYVRKPD